MKKTVITLAILLVAAAAIFFILRNNKAKNEKEVAVVAEKNTKVSVKTAAVQYESVTDNTAVNGTFIPEQQANIAAETGGQLVAIYVKEGSYVKPGQVIAKLKGDKQDVGLNNAQATLDNAKLALSRFEAAYKTGGVTALQLDQARLAVKNAQAQMRSAQLTSGDTTVRSRIGGIVNRKMAEVGTVVAPGTPIVEVVNISSVKLKVDVDESMVSSLSTGQIVSVKPAVSENAVEGRITFIAPASAGALKFPVEITVKNPGNSIRAGMYGTASFGNSQSKSYLVIPRSAFVGGVSENTVFVVKEGVAKMIKVESGQNFGDRVEILSGLKPGDVVVTSGQINLTDNTPVDILK